MSSEVGKRIDLWNAGRLSDLLLRVEAQALLARGGGPPGDAEGARRRRACRLARAGAYSKAAATATSEVAHLTDAEQLSWAEKLLPVSGQPDAACSGVCPADATVDPEEPVAAARRLEAVSDEIRRIRFAPLSAAGPSGRRPEHFRDLAGVRRHRAGRRLVRALAAFAIAAEEGRLPAEARWILDSSLVYLKKKHGNKPRPVRIGEVLRRLAAKRHCARAAPAVRRALLAARQVGVAVPGACEGLVHSQRALEELLSTGRCGA